VTGGVGWPFPPPAKVSYFKGMKVKDEKPVRLNSTLLDSHVCDAIRKYITVARQQGREDRATLALELLSKFNPKEHAIALAQHQREDSELIAELQTYRQAVESQGRADRISWVSQSFVALHSDAIEDLRDEFNAKLQEIEKQMSALTPTKRR
jgi:hypothetical protein